MAGPGADPIGEEGPRYYCVNHPNTETLIRCSKCLDPICQKCAVPTPVGLRCRKCAYANRSPLYVIKPQHVLLAAVVGLAMALAAAAAVAAWERGELLSPQELAAIDGRGDSHDLRAPGPEAAEP